MNTSITTTTTFFISPLFEKSGATTTKYFYFNGQRVAMRINGVLQYLHADHLGSTVLTTNATNANLIGDEGYLAYGRNRRGNGVPTDFKFTGQKQDGSGLQYFNARYFDPQVGVFISPDGLIPDATAVFDYQRYAYAKMNPIKFDDPSGHCAASEPGVATALERHLYQACWATVDNILRAWDREKTGYFDTRYGSREDFLKYIAPSGALDYEYMQKEYAMYPGNPVDSSQKSVPVPWDLGDYTSINASAVIMDTSIIIDDYGNVYWRVGTGLSLPGLSVHRGDIFIAPSDASPSEILTIQSPMTDIDQMGLTRSEKSELSQEIFPGTSVSVGGGYIVDFNIAMNASVPHHITAEGGFTTGSSAGADSGFTMRLWPLTD